jgi:tripartite-type tricarboxylate transporter receptor subunit TctC
MQTRTFLTTLGLALAFPSISALAQIASGRPIRMIVPLPAGTSNDFATRTTAPHISQLLGQAVVVDNKAGANGAIATMEVVRAAPDGLTLMCGSLSPLAANVAFVKNLPYDPRRDLTAIAGSTVTNHALMVKASSPIRTFADFIAYAKQRPGKVSVGSSTSIVQLQIASINRMAGIELLTVPYKGSPATLTDVIGGVLDATMTDQGNAMAQVKGGNLRALAVTSIKRNPSAPDWPAISETLPGFDFSSWNAYVGPPGMSRDVVGRLAAVIAQAQKSPDVVQQLANSGTIPLILGPDETRALIEAEVTKYQRLAKEAGIQAE